MRRVFALPDTNMFVTVFILYSLIEAEKNGVNLNKEIVDMGAEAMSEYRDKNLDRDSGLYCFWQQTRNETSNHYFSYPSNLNGPLDDFPNLSKSPISILLKAFKIDFSKVATLFHQLSLFLRVSPDSDDTSVILALNAQIDNSAFKYPETNFKMKASNPNINKTIESLTYYTYRPFSEDKKRNAVNPRTYFVIHQFIEDWVSNGRNQEDLVLPFTWMMDFPFRSDQYPFTNLVISSNDIDFCVAINTFYGLASSIIQHGNSIISLEVKRMLSSIAYLIEWGINSELVYDRKDLALVYYPSIYTFSWFVSRVVDFLETENQKSQNQMPSILNDSLVLLRDAMMNGGTNQMLKRMKSDGNGGVYWEDFLGNADTLQGVKKEYGEDRFYSSALALNVLIDTWTITCGDTVNRRWRDNTPHPVKAAVNNGISFIVDNILENPTQTFNAFFDMSFRGPSTYPTSYPINYCYDNNGIECKFTPSNPEGVMGVVSGIIPHTKYQEMLKMKWANNTVPTTWSGSFNPVVIPYFSSQPLTYSVSILALSKSLNIQT
ncbi:hypothetical protein PPL_03978 [Heterostelium album PN500]|uniref:Uncharacterized protein n=1 Tax=Heterostelium pallidum (strain ATCC 26659 / Pp 5 / PN500) TaxID=670386 RepID=D3B5P0_HETP5|nr:hypothetical protein PPL_03978 [Heterostelium album PN500]EFA83188.1 hypothetical protein PPL_03978 [Heterostelium album PN500]|eukprot:XP_020435305.1 hypothetical protein PPL_03978 [Heterostelium album PN500]